MIYIDSEFKCHITNDGTMRPVEEPFFDGKCADFVEGYRLKPDDETWIREDGKIFSGAKMITPWKPYPELDSAQREYEKRKLAEYEDTLKKLAEYEEALKKLGVEV